ncbi:DUF2797 domain-containing protein [Streptomyces sp. NPDC087851]|uniref:DUF2797 domain-containing protein n=1 Tax=Streptomyces sp. NPDC087851 TaxID=3365810 RepID=UPI00382E7A9F
MAWECDRLRWVGGAPVLRWRRGGERRESGLVYGRDLGFRAVGARRCAGARGNVCPLGALIPGRSTGGRCAECARLERAHSVAADTLADDPRTYRVYLAWFGPGMVKVGITAEQRGSARLLEQGAVAFSWLGRGPLMAARRTEELVRRGLGVPDRVPYAAKRAVRYALPGPAERAGQVGRLYARAVALEGWPQSLERVECAVVDHAGVFGLGDGEAGTSVVAGVVGELVDGGRVAGRLVAAAGPDLHLAPTGDEMERTEVTEVVVVDTRLMSGWELVASAGAVTVPVVDIRGDGGDGGDVQDGLF